MDAAGAFVEDRLGLDDVRVGDAAVDGADGRASFLLVETAAFRAEQRVDDEDVLALADRLVRALRLARAAVDAFHGDRRRHGSAIVAVQASHARTETWSGRCASSRRRVAHFGARAAIR